MTRQTIKKYSTRNKSSRKNKTSRRNKRKSQKKTKNTKKGGNNNENVTCSMCERDVKIKDTLLPRVCLNEHGRKAHRICSECWWNPETGFAREGTRHGCPGCEKKLPLTNISNVPSSNKNKPVNVIDLTED
jgi:hypothetical protein